MRLKVFKRLGKYASKADFEIKILSVFLQLPINKKGYFLNVTP